jgi:hypothetical protein
MCDSDDGIYERFSYFTIFGILELTRLLAVNRGLRPLFERLEVPDHPFAAIVGEFKVLGEFQRVRWAGVFAQAAEHAAAQIVGKLRELFATRLLIAFTGNNDEVFGTSHRAQITGNAERLVGIRIDVQPRRAPVTFSNLWTLERILLGVDLFGILIAERYAESLNQVYQEHLPQNVVDSHYLARITPSGNAEARETSMEKRGSLRLSSTRRERSRDAASRVPAGRIKYDPTYLRLV